MKKTWILVACLFTATAWARPQAPSPASDTLESAPLVSVWAQPVGTLAFGLDVGNRVNSEPLFDLNRNLLRIGASF